MQRFKDWLIDQTRLSIECDDIRSAQAYKKVSAYLETFGIPQEVNHCQHVWGLMHPINTDNQKYLCLNCDEIK